MENGEKFSFKDHKYLFELYAEHHDHVVVEKAAQMGITSWAFIMSIYHCINTFSLGTIYFFPTKTDVMDFSRGRITPFIKYNKHIKILDDDDVDNVGLKRVGKSLIYFRGMQTDIGLKSVPSDQNVYDEIDEANPQAKDMADQRMEHSKFKWQKELSNPTIENYGIDRSFQESDMRYWAIKCGHCNAWNILELEFPNCLLRKKDGTVIRVCKKCRKEISLDGKAQWVAKKPSNKDKRGYHMSQLFSKYVSPKKILDAYEEVSTTALYKQETFYRLCLGMAFTSGQNKLVKEDMLNLPRADMSINIHDYAFMGVDQGNKLHSVIIKELKDGHTGLMDIIVKTDFNDIDKIMQDNKCLRLVIDAMPETREAKRLAERHPGRVFLCYYNDNMKGNYKWTDDTENKNWLVSVNRTDSLDASGSVIKEKKLIINKSINDSLVEEFAEQCCNLARKKEEALDGSQRYVYIKTGPDHWRHAFNYSKIAATDFVESADVDMETIASAFDKAPELVSAQFDG